VKEGASLRDATEKVYGKPEPVKPEPTKAEATPPADPFAAEEAKLKAELAALEKDGEKADDEVNVRESRRVAIEINRRERALERIADKREAAAREVEARQRTEAEQKQQTEQERDYAVLVEKYPTLGDNKSSDFTAFRDFVQKSASDPGLAPLLKLSNWRGLFGDLAVARGIISPKAAAPSIVPTSSAPKPGTAQVAPRPPNASKVLTSREATPPAQSFQNISAEQLERDLSDMPIEAMDAMLNGKTSFTPRPKRK
jgi:hypothetical protein